jgi:hypothetical protein
MLRIELMAQIYAEEHDYANPNTNIQLKLFLLAYVSVNKSVDNA